MENKTAKLNDTSVENDTCDVFDKPFVSLSIVKFEMISRNQIIWKKILGTCDQSLGFNAWDDGNVAAKLGHARLMELKMGNFKKISQAAWLNAADNGHLGVIEYLHSICFDGYTFQIMDIAAKNGCMKMVEWLHQNKKEGCSIRAMDGAAENGHLRIVEWLHRKRREGCSVQAMNQACRHGHLESVEWLYKHRNEGCNQSALDLACMSGHIMTAKWLLQKNTLHPSMLTVELAACFGQLQTLEWLLSLLPSLSFWSSFPIVNDEKNEEMLKSPHLDDRCIRVLDYLYNEFPSVYLNTSMLMKWKAAAACEGNLHVLEWLFQHFVGGFGISISSTAVCAARNGHLHVLQWLDANCPDLFLTGDEIFCAAASAGHLDVLEWIFEQMGPSSIHHLFQIDVIGSGHLHVVEWFIQNGCQSRNLLRIDIAATHGHTNLFKFLFKLNHLQSPVYSIIAKSLRGAAKHGYLHLIEWTHKAMKGTKDYEKWLKTLWIPRHLPDILSIALEAGNMHIVLALHEKFRLPQEVPVLSLYRAAAQGWISVFEWLEKNYNLSCLPENLLNHSAGGGHMILSQLLDRLYSSCIEVSACTSAAMDSAAANGHLGMVEWLSCHRTEGCTTLAVDQAAANCHFRVVCWLLENRREGCTAAALKNACRNGDFCTAEYLLNHRCLRGLLTQPVLARAMCLCVEGGHLHVLKILWERRTGHCCETVVQVAFRRGHRAIVEWLQQKAPGMCLLRSQSQLPTRQPERIKKSKRMHNMAAILSLNEYS